MQAKITSFACFVFVSKKRIESRKKFKIIIWVQKAKWIKMIVRVKCRNPQSFRILSYGKLFLFDYIWMIFLSHFLVIAYAIYGKYRIEPSCQSHNPLPWIWFFWVLSCPSWSFWWTIVLLLSSILLSILILLPFLLNCKRKLWIFRIQEFWYRVLYYHKSTFLKLF